MTLSGPRPALLLLVVAACGPAAPGAGEESGEDGALEDVEVDGADAGAPALASEDLPDTVDVGSWNLAWYGDDSKGPDDDLLQQDNVARVLSQTDLDLVGLVEVVSPDAFDRLLDALPEHDGLLVTDPRVTGGAGSYAAGEQKVALLFHRRFTVESARVILTDATWDFAGRPPLEVTLSFTEDGAARTLVVVVAHFKAMANADGYERRLAAAAAMHAYLDAEYASRWVLVIGDLNDDIDRSTYWGHPSPFTELVEDPEYRFTTDALTEAGMSTTVHFSSTIDHHMATDELAWRFVEGSARVLPLDQEIAAYGDTTSDHYPVLTRYDLR
ncbi:MAG TPA: endonuclease/exonuclease/phosphatase family protein [Kofleriaceae bacterium]|nr:endonuclease/exonuclease/phosphatase family protein [Kofleriaceae bacterium]